jgi:serine/threonine-protein kinase
MLTQGTVIHADYRVLERIGQGEIGEVYRAERLATEQACVLKVLSAGLMTESLLIERFKEEAKRASTFRHPNAVRIEGVGEAEDGRPFVVMEYLPGENLGEAIAREGRLPVARACFITRHVATVLEAAHALGFVHQDVTPGNIMLVETPASTRVSLLDCCIGRIKEDRRRDMGRIALRGHGVLMGAPEYFSPEMVVGKRGSELDGRSDLYSLGVVLYRMLCGESPFEVKSGTVDALLAHLLIPPKSVSALCPDAPEELRRLVMRMLEKKPESRPASSRAVVEELEKVEVVLRQTSRRAPAVVSPREAAETAPAALPSVTSTAISPSDSLSQSAGTAVVIQPDTVKPEAPVPHPPPPLVHPRPAATQETSRRWLRFATGTAITAVFLGFVAWFLAPVRSKLTPYFQPDASGTSATSGRSSGEATDRTGQTGQSATIPASQPKAPPATSSPGTSTALSEGSPHPTAKPGASASQGEDTVGEQAAPPRGRASEVNRGAPRPNPDPATVRALVTEGDGFFRQGEYDRAIQSYLRALRLDPSSEALHTKILRARTAKAAEEKYLNE